MNCDFYVKDKKLIFIGFIVTESLGGTAMKVTSTGTSIA